MQKQCYKKRNELGTFGLSLTELAREQPVEYNDFKKIFRFIQRETTPIEVSGLIHPTDFEFNYLFNHQKTARKIIEHIFGRKIKVI